MYGRKRKRLGIRLGKHGQVSIEMALSIICVFLLLMGILKIFTWLNCRMVMQQEFYESTRVEAGSSDAGEDVVILDEDKLPRLDVFGDTPPYIKIIE